MKTNSILAVIVCLPAIVACGNREAPTPNDDVRGAEVVLQNEKDVPARIGDPAVFVASVAKAVTDFDKDFFRKNTAARVEHVSCSGNQPCMERHMTLDEFIDGIDSEGDCYSALYVDLNRIQGWYYKKEQRTLTIKPAIDFSDYLSLEFKMESSDNSWKLRKVDQGDGGPGTQGAVLLERGFSPIG